MNRKLIHIGTSGWSYWHWEEFYQGTLFQDRLSFLCPIFFYRGSKRNLLLSTKRNDRQKLVQEHAKRISFCRESKSVYYTH